MDAGRGRPTARHHRCRISRLPKRRDCLSVHIDHIGEELVRIDSENALLLFDADTLHKPVTRVLRAALSSPTIRDAVAAILSEGSGVIAPGKITFPTHRNSVPNTHARPSTGHGHQVLTPHRAGVKRKRNGNEESNRSDYHPRHGSADVFCIYEPLDSDSDPDNAGAMDNEGNAEGEANVLDSITVAEEQEAMKDVEAPTMRSAGLLFVKEAKAPHKLTLAVIDQAVGLGDAVLTPADIMNAGDAGSEPTNPDQDDHDSKYWFAAVCSQLYSSMIEAGLRYGIITTGACYVFVSIDPIIPSILRYSICKTTADIHDSPIMCIVAFALLAMRSSQLPRTTEYDAIFRRAGLNWTSEPQNVSFYTEKAPGDTPKEASGETPGMESYRDDESASSNPRQEARSTGLPRADPPSPRPEQRHVSQAAYPSPPPQFLGKRQRQEPGAANQKTRKKPKMDATSVEAVRPATPTPSPRSSPSNP
ncbi:unnamed protein product [Discula destructiva]